MRRINPKAFTLMELVVVLAVVSIMTVMVVSFTIICNGWGQWGTSRYNVTASERRAEQYLRTFIAAYDNQDYYFTTADEGGTLVATAVADPTEKHRFYLADNGTAQFELPDGTAGNVPLDHITSIRFDLRANAQDQQLVRMTMAYNLPNTVIKSSARVGSFSVYVCTRATGAAV